MSSDSEDENFCFYGKALEPYDEDAFPKKRPISIEEQIATDAQGRRRFHGAFTGGFSAGFFNTVGSLEGWTPAEFKSSRSDKADRKVQRPEDYMDEEDVGEFGIAPQVVRAKDEFANKKKRKKKLFADGPIPGEPVLETLLSSGNETVGYLLLRNMGLKHGGEGEESEASGAKVYGCEMPKIQETNKPYEVVQYPIPEIYKEFLNKPKSNTFGLGYSGLDKSHISLFQSTNLVVKERDNKKLSISGQAFGVGAFEEEDEDIYSKDNMSKYDFELTAEATTTKNTTKDQESTVFELFKLAKDKLSLGEHFPPPVLPHSFSGKHNVKKSRFEPLPEEKTAVVERKKIDANIRAKYLGEEQSQIVTPSNQQQYSKVNAEPKQSACTPIVQSPEEDERKSSSIGGFNLLLDKFVSGTQSDSQDILEPVKPSENLHGTKEMRDAAAMKMFGPLTRTTFDWQPCSLLCKRFNVPEPNSVDSNQKSKKRTKHLIFEYQKESESEALNKSGLTILKKEVDEPKTKECLAEVDNNVSNMEIAQEVASTSEVRTESTADFIVEMPESNGPIDLTERVDVAKNTDLFRAIFLDTSESENEDENEAEEDKAKSETLKNNVLSDNLLPKIKAKQGGVLSNIDFSQLTPAPPALQTSNGTSLESSNNSIISVDDSKTNSSTDDLSYGPKVPQMLANTNRNSASFRMEESDDEWVEKGGEEKKNSNKHKKKKKKDKYDHKKTHKHKHGRKRK